MWRERRQRRKATPDQIPRLPRIDLNISSQRNVYAAIFHKYPRPIPTPVENLRPAKQTCEQCHWPRKFYGAQLKVFYHYASDEKNSPRQIRMLINTGGAEPRTGLPSGIHWHITSPTRSPTSQAMLSAR
jgi:hypothetical protein